MILLVFITSPLNNRTPSPIRLNTHTKTKTDFLERSKVTIGSFRKSGKGSKQTSLELTKGLTDQRSRNTKTQSDNFSSLTWKTQSLISKTNVRRATICTQTSWMVGKKATSAIAAGLQLKTLGLFGGVPMLATSLFVTNADLVVE